MARAPKNKKIILGPMLRAQIGQSVVFKTPRLYMLRSYRIFLLILVEPLQSLVHQILGI